MTTMTIYSSPKLLAEAIPALKSRGFYRASSIITADVLFADLLDAGFKVTIDPLDRRVIRLSK